jgi:putative endonuclease
MITVYVLKGEMGRRYVGITNNLARRLKEHNNKATKAGHLLGSFDLLHTEKYPDYKSARERELFLKSGRGRKWLDEYEPESRPARGG